MMKHIVDFALLFALTAVAFTFGCHVGAGSFEPSAAESAAAKVRLEWLCEKSGLQLCGAGAVGPAGDPLPDNHLRDKYGRLKEDVGKIELSFSETDAALFVKWWMKHGKKSFSKWRRTKENE